MSEKKLFLLDGHALVYRAHFAFITRPLINSKGLNTSAINGFTTQLWELMRNEKPTHLAVAFDPPGATFRNDMYEPYKANREETPDDIRAAFPWIVKIVEAMNIPIVQVLGYEADDVIGTLAKKAEKEGYTVYMVTPDKDYGQLVSDKVFMYKPSRQGNGIEIMGPKEVCENWGIKRVEQVIDLLGLMGDSVDNIPGIPGVGEKTAAKLLDRFDTLEGVIAGVDQLKGKEQERVQQYAEQAILSKQLATIELNVPIEFEPEKLTIDPVNREVLSEIFKELEFRSIATKILGEGEAKPAPVNKVGTQGSLFPDEPASAAAPIQIGSNLPAHSVAEKNILNTPHTYHLVDTEAGMRDLATKLAEQSEICFDTETTHVEPTQAELVGMSFAISASEAYYVPVPEGKAAAQAIVEIFRAVLEDEKVVKIGQNLKYDLIVLKWYDVEVAGAIFDTMIAHYLLEPEKRHGMDYLAETYLSYSPVSIEELIGKKGKGQVTMREVPVEQVKEYAAEDADVTLQLKQFFAPRLEEGGVQKLFDTIEAPLVRVLADLEYEGVRIDSNYLAEYSKELDVNIAAAETAVYEKAGTKFNIGSPKQVGEVLFDQLKIPYKGAKTKTGQYSTDEDKLLDLGADYPVVESILAFRALTKLKSTYVDALPKLVNPRTGRIHSSFNQALAATGRLSSNNPNLQNIPVRTPEGAKVRKAFVPRDAEHTLLSADYSQIELRLIAEISSDEAMLEAFQQNLDIHLATASKVFNVPLDQLSREQRYQAKTVNFSIIYGAGATNLSRQLNIKRPEAKELIDAYFSQYTGLKRYMDNIVEEARKNGYVTTLMGRRRYLRDIHSKSSLERSNAERIAINTPIQGSAADLVKVAMININRELKSQKLASKMILQVHDELVFDVPLGEVETVKPIISEYMRTALPNLRVPIEVGMGTGSNWLEAH
jgi:DNA polymerase I